ncbi:PA14 domain-containing protein [Rhodocytophaga aerolata]|uniref:PA14 domain-containing protein n=1 Tax=Rhodocytophaga aerolata TaxID=455078 RepID=A0ABT8RHF9_9BACT|nr:ELWxxDGT repeat protein [Rhodocytophaga aerolata]MDO1450235.1 PA14 domain-containing protein [Rhodocytophaga aerolata]
MFYFSPFTSLCLATARHTYVIAAKQAVLVVLALFVSFSSLIAQENPTGLTHVNGTLFFAASSPDKGTELWKSNGTIQSTVLVKDIASMTASSSPFNLKKIGSSLFFTANGTQLWKSNGTAEGTLLVKSFTSSNPSPFSQLTDVNGVLYFVFYKGSNTYELWKSDGTASGTTLVKTVLGSMYGSFTQLTNLNGVLYFASYEAATGFELWKSNGTAVGTVLVKDIYPGTESSVPSNLYVWNGNLYFAADNGSVGTELWKSNGTAAGTVLLKNIKPDGEPFDLGSSPSEFISFKGELYFRASDVYGNYDTGTDFYGLWKTNGTNQGTVKVKSIPGLYPQELTVVNDKLFFIVNHVRVDEEGNSSYHQELWKSDGTETGTGMIKAFGLGLDNKLLSFKLTNLNGTLLFASPGSQRGWSPDGELWKSDGTAQGTVQVKNIYRDRFAPNFYDSSFPDELTPINNTLLFSAYDGIGGKRQLWKSDATQAGTTKLTPTLPTPWKSQDIGAVAIAGSANYNNDIIPASFLFTLESGGYDFYKAPDAFRYVYQPFTGNGTITAYVENMGNTHPYALAGLMIREDLSANSSFAAVAVNPSGNTNFMWRQGAGTPGYTSVAAHKWLRLERKGNTFSAYYSTGAEQSWTLIGTMNIAMGNTVYIGMALTSQNNSTLNTATFSRVQVRNTPVVTLTSPSPNSSYAAPASITLAANVSGFNGSIYGVDFYHGNTFIGGDAQSPYSYTWTNVPAGTYSLTAVVNDGNGVATRSDPVVITVGSTPICSATGSILREFWSGIPGKEISSIPVNSAPLTSTQLPSFEAPTNVSDNYGQRLRGYICAPATGNYTFYLASDDNGELWLSSSDDAALKQKIASVTGYTTSRQWTKYATQKSATIALQAGKKYYIEALHKEGAGGDNLAVGWQTPTTTTISVIPGSVLSPADPAGPFCHASGTILREYWANISGGSVASIPLTTTPTSSTQIASFETPSNIGDNYGQRIRGYLCAPATGDYTFYLASDDQGELWIGTTDNPLSKIKIAYITGHTSSRQWTKYASQKSVAVTLQAGHKYYIEALHKEAVYGDNLAVGWTIPGSSSISVIPGSVLSPFVPSAARLASEENLQLSIAVYPNPFTNRMRVATNGQQGKVLISLTDVVGKTYFVKEYILSGQSELELDLAGVALSHGLHLLKLQTQDGKTHVMKVIKN